MDFTPHTAEDVESMLKEIGVSSIEELISMSLPERARLKEELKLPSPLSELEAERKLEQLSALNAPENGFISFLGAGVYNHYIPAVVDAVISKPEFFTAYTPYQPEVSQGTLAAIFEFQTMIANLTGLDVANASMYDGATALAEAVLMARRLVSLKTPGSVAVLEPFHPHYKSVLKTYLEPHSIEIVAIKHVDGIPDIESLEQKLEEEQGIFAVVIPQPTFYGTIYDYRDFIRAAKERDIITIVQHDPHLLGIMKSPGELGADIAAGEAQPLGNPLNFGGPLLGYLSCKKEHIRQLPGRIIGETVDVDGNRVFVMTLQTREQHIRRERATSNICTNEALCALAATVYLSWYGKEGFRELAGRIFSVTMHAAESLKKAGEIPYRGPYFKDFVIRLNTDTEEVLKTGIREKIIPGIPLFHLDPNAKRNELLVSVTEKTVADDIEKLVEFLGRF